MNMKRDWYERSAQPDGKVAKFFQRFIGTIAMVVGATLLSAAIIGPFGVIVGVLAGMVWYGHCVKSEERRIARAKQKLEEMEE